MVVAAALLASMRPFSKGNDSNKGLELLLPDDASYALVTEVRDPDPVQAVRNVESSATSYLTLTCPLGLPDAYGAEGNDWRTRIQEGVAGVDGTQATAHVDNSSNTAIFSTLTIPDDLPNAAGNLGNFWRLYLVKGAEAQAAVLAAQATVDWTNGAGLGIRITMAGTEASTVGEDGNDWDIYSNENLSVTTVTLQISLVSDRISLHLQH